MEAGKKGVRKWGRGWVSRRIFGRDILNVSCTCLSRQKEEPEESLFFSASHRMHIICITTGKVWERLRKMRPF